MGVKGLWTKVESDFRRRGVEVQEDIINGSVLLVDGMGFIFHLLDHQAEYLHVTHQSFRELGGSYSAIQQMLDTEINRLQSLGFSLIFYLDGSTSYYKGDTAAKRRQQLVEKWSNMYYAGLGDSAINQSKLPLPTLCNQALQYVIKSQKLSFVKCELEADQPIALACSAGNDEDDGPEYYCYSSDSDFLMMKNCQTIKFGDLDDIYPPKEASKGKFDVVCRVNVWSRSKLAEFYQSQEVQLVKWAALSGNDYTDHFEPEQLGIDEDSSSLEELLSICQQDEDPFDLSSITNRDAKMAVAYSVALYELEDITPFHLEEYKTHNQLELMGDLETGLVLTAKQKDILKDWISTQSPTRMSSIDGQDISDKTTAFLDAVITGRVSQEAIDLFDVVERPFIDALKQCNTIIRNHLPRPAISGKLKITWQSQRFVNLFQQLARAVAKEVSSGCDEDEAAETWQPAHVYDGLLFYHALNNPTISSPKPAIPVIQAEATGFLPPPAAAFPVAFPPSAAASSTNFGGGLDLMSRLSSLASKVNNSTKDSKGQKSPDLNSKQQKNSGNGKAGPSIPVEQPAKGTKAAKAAANKKAEAVPFPPPPSAASEATSSRPKPGTLPTDAYREQIMDLIDRERVTIIHGETGCGKSSRIPVFILEEAEQKKQYCKVMITQPRRIAVLNLKRRLTEQLGSKIGMRMGHGVREESNDTKIFFVTTGYLVRLIAHHPQALSSITHIVIDEVHERSMDSDLLCWLCRQHLAECKETKLILMSATLHTTLYASYFFDNRIMKAEPTCISVGQRRFPIEIFYIEDIFADKKGFHFPPKMKGNANTVIDCCSRGNAPLGGQAAPVPQQLAKNQYDIVIGLIRSKVEVGTGVLVFVSGIADIVELQSRFDFLDRYEVVAIHSEIPFEEQEQALLPCESHKVKVILATNAAESSVTLPNVDVVICLGTHKAVNYKSGDAMRSMLENIWISKSSAIQRAGRTGRIRPGTVYRLYTKSLYEGFIDFEQAEIHRKPLHEVVLSLKATFQDAHGHQGVVPILEKLLEAPDLSKMDECFEYLFKNRMISAPNDSARLTSLGTFAGHMPLDVALSNLIIFGINLGVGAEAVIAASALSQPKTPFRIAHRVIHTDPMEFNEIIRQTFLGACFYDDGAYSDPIMMLNMYVDWQNASREDQYHLAGKHGIVAARIRHFVSFATHLLRQVNQLTAETYHSDMQLSFDNLQLDMNSYKLNRLRLALLWSLDYNLISSAGRKEKKTSFDHDLNALHIHKNALSKPLLEELFPSEYIRKKEITLGKYLYEIPPPFMNAAELGSCLRRMVSFISDFNGFYVSASFSEEVIMHPDQQLMFLQQQQQLHGKKAKKMKDMRQRFVHILLAVKQVEGKSVEFMNGMLVAMRPLVPRWCGDVDTSTMAATMPALSIYAFDGILEEDYNRYMNYMTQANGLLLSVRSNGEAKLLSVNVPLTAAFLRSMYDSNIFELNPEVAVVLVKASKPAKQFDLTQKIQFYYDDEDEDVNVEEEKLKRKAAAYSEHEAGKDHELFKDLTMGMRLFNAYCVGTKDRKLKYRNRPEQEAKGASSALSAVTSAKIAPRIVPGSVAWAQQKKKEAASTQIKESLTGGDAIDIDDEIELRRPRIVTGATIDESQVETCQAGMVVSPWKIISGAWELPQAPKNDEDDDESDDDDNYMDLQATWSNVMLSTRSIISASCHGPFGMESPLPLFGVAYSAMEIGRSVMVEGVTLFPLGMDWVLRGLLCVGKRLVDHAEDLIDHDPEEDVEEEQFHANMNKLVQLAQQQPTHAHEFQQQRIMLYERHQVELLRREKLKIENAASSRRAQCARIRKIIDSFIDRNIEYDHDLAQGVDNLFADIIYLHKGEESPPPPEQQPPAQKFRAIDNSSANNNHGRDRKDYRNGGGHDGNLKSGTGDRDNHRPQQTQQNRNQDVRNNVNNQQRPAAERGSYGGNQKGAQQHQPPKKQNQQQPKGLHRDEFVEKAIEPVKDKKNGINNKQQQNQKQAAKSPKSEAKQPSLVPTAIMKAAKPSPAVPKAAPVVKSGDATADSLDALIDRPASIATPAGRKEQREKENSQNKKKQKQQPSQRQQQKGGDTESG